VTLLRAEVKEVSGALTLVRLGRKSMLARCGGLPRNTRSPWGESSIVTMEDEYETAPKLSNGTNFNDLE